ncbi:hypothetical protein D9619_007163 [Psilocybe cf. subviscida]|uniref:Uncharacterized protein n=1 Tax=Psilocybe cf. subviscida TaxID=2480587 RepID=A0A8H5B1N8_9AGAR|nr:hypothetical protein D9619_007163 [Psilocybe cf. subviscida]
MSSTAPSWTIPPCPVLIPTNDKEAGHDPGEPVLVLVDAAPPFLLLPLVPVSAVPADPGSFTLNPAGSTPPLNTTLPSATARASAFFFARAPRGALPGPRRRANFAYSHGSPRATQCEQEGRAPSQRSLRPVVDYVL